jgi:hypothetical protein
MQGQQQQAVSRYNNSNEFCAAWMLAHWVGRYNSGRLTVTQCVWEAGTVGWWLPMVHISTRAAIARSSSQAAGVRAHCTKYAE